MKCPYCKNLEDKVIDSRISKDGEIIRRRRECLGCAKRFTTHEKIEDNGATNKSRYVMVYWVKLLHVFGNREDKNICNLHFPCWR